MNAVAGLREKLELSQAAFAGRLGVDQATVSRLESGLADIDRRTQLAMRQVASDAGVDLPADFFGGSPPKDAAA